MVDDGVTLEEVEVLEVELAPARKDEYAEEVRLAPDLLIKRLHYLRKNIKTEQEMQLLVWTWQKKK